MTLRAIGYCRISSDAQRDNTSLDAQRRAITDACLARGYMLAEIVTDEAISARSERIELRPGLVRVMAAVDAGQVDVLVVHSLDRLARNIMVTLQVFKRLAAHGVAFVSLSEAIDYATPEGKLQITILGAFAGYFSDNLAKHVAKGHRERALRGHPAGRPPLGYAHDDKRNLIPDPQAALAVRAMFAAYASGASMRSLLLPLHAAGYMVRRSGVWYMLHNRTYIGQVRYREEWLVGQHERLIDDATWQACQAHLDTNRRTHNAPAARLKLFSGLLRCARCGASVQAGAQVDIARVYLCSRRRDLAACDAPGARETTLAAQLPAILAQLAIDDATVARMAAAQPVPPTVDRKAIGERLERLRETYELGDIGRERYLSRRMELVRERDAVPETMPVDYAALAAQVRDLVGLWDAGTQDERRVILTTLWRDILTDGRTIVALRPQPPLLPLVAELWPAHERSGYYVPLSR